MLNFARELVYFRREHPVFRRRKWFQGQAIYGAAATDINWYNPDGSTMTQEQWEIGYAKSIALFLNGNKIPGPNPQGQRISDDSFLIFFNAHYEMLEFHLPVDFQNEQWKLIIDTKEPQFVRDDKYFTGEDLIPVMDRSIVVLSLNQ